MRILVIGAGHTGAHIIRQLQKNKEIEIVTADPREEHVAVEEGIIDKVDIREQLTPMNIDSMVEKARPDVVILAMPTEDMGLGKAPGVEMLADALRDEIAAIADVPVIEAARISQ